MSIGYLLYQIGFLQPLDFLWRTFLYSLDKIIPHLHLFAKREDAEGVPTKWRKTVLLVLAIALHNIPEGLAVGVAFGALTHKVVEVGRIFCIYHRISDCISYGDWYWLS